MSLAKMENSALGPYRLKAHETGLNQRLVNEKEFKLADGNHDGNMIGAGVFAIFFCTSAVMSIQSLTAWDPSYLPWVVPMLFCLFMSRMFYHKKKYWGEIVCLYMRQQSHTCRACGISLIEKEADA